MKSIVAVNPSRARMWSLHDRCDQHVSEESCKAEIASFAKHGQLVPALGRALRGDPDYDVELIYGARRLFVARHLNKPLLVEMRQMSDREAIIAMDIENRQRSDLSQYERALSYARWIRNGHFGSQDDIARALKVSASQVSRLLRLAKLPSVILNAFASPLEICEAWGLDIMDALDDAERRQRTIQVARTIGAMEPRPPARQVYRQLITASVRGRQPKPAARIEIVRAADGAPLFRIRQLSNSVSLVLPGDKLSAATMAEVRKALVEILQSGTQQTSESTQQRPFAAPMRERRTGTGDRRGAVVAVLENCACGQGESAETSLSLQAMRN